MITIPMDYDGNINNTLEINWDQMLTLPFICFYYSSQVTSVKHEHLFSTFTQKKLYDG